MVRSWGQIPYEWDWRPIREPPLSSLTPPPREASRRRRQPWATQPASDTKSAGASILGFPASTRVKNILLWLISHQCKLLGYSSLDGLRHKANPFVHPCDFRHLLPLGGSNLGVVCLSQGGEGLQSHSVIWKVKSWALSSLGIWLQDVLPCANSLHLIQEKLGLALWCSG